VLLVHDKSFAEQLSFSGYHKESATSARSFH
jgi:hypothetical protein